MKKLFSNLIFGLILVLFPLLNVQAASTYSILPDGSVDVFGETQVQFDLYLNAEEDIPIRGVSLDFEFDTTELNLGSHLESVWNSSTGSMEEIEKYDISFELTGFSSFNTSNIRGDINTGQFTIDYAKGPIDQPYFALDGSSILLATFVFDVVNVEFFDGFSDFELIRQEGSKGLLHANNIDILQFEGVLSADVGTVPIPSSLFLLSCGIFAVAGINRRKK